MKNKLILIFMTLVICVGFIGCGRNNNILHSPGHTNTHNLNNTNGHNNVTNNGLHNTNGAGTHGNDHYSTMNGHNTTNNHNMSNMSHTATEGDLTITLLSAKEEQIKGTHGENNAIHENGNFFMFGTNARKVEDYKKIVLAFKMENKSTGPIGYSANGWTFEKVSNADLEHHVESTNMKYHSIPANGSIEEKIEIYVRNNVDVGRITAIYNHMNYNEDYWTHYGKFLSGDITREEHENRYNNTKEIRLSINVT